MRILTICSTLDFVNFTRRATIQAIHKINPEQDVLLYNSLLNIRKAKRKTSGIRFFNYHFWIPETFRKIYLLTVFEHFFRGQFRWKNFFHVYHVVLLTDPNQYYLLPYISPKQKLVYLLRDPSLLQNPGLYHYELRIIKRADLILGISKNLCHYYFEKYYDFVPNNVQYWPNTVDLELWDYEKWISYKRENKNRPIAGLSGNINYVNDLDLLEFIVKDNSEIDFEIAGKIDLDANGLQKLNGILQFSNVRHLGFIPYNEFPGIVINWDVGLVVADLKHEYARYLNNNKQYQYLALGKPFVTFNLNADYDEFGEFVYVTDDYQSFSAAIKKAIMTNNTRNIKNGFAIAKKHSSLSRAKQFMQYVEQLF